MGAEAITVKLRELLVDVATSRREFEDDPQQFLEILVGAAALYPVFDGWPSPVDEWLEEAERLGREVDAEAAPELWQETMGLLAVRRAIVAMRRRNQEGALRALEAARQPGMPPRVRLWEAATRARVHVRQHAFDEAERALAEAGSYVPELLPGDGLLEFVSIARAELALEQGNSSAEQALRKALAEVHPDSVEERVQLHQELALTLVTRADAAQALEHFTHARELVAAAGVQSEVVQMDLAVGSLRLGLGDVAGAESAFREASSIVEAHPQPMLEPLLRLSVARARAAAGDSAQAAAECLRAANAFAQQGHVFGYVGMISFLHTLQLEAGDNPEAYRTLATGLSIARRLGLASAEALFRTLVNRMRDVALGPERFDRMVEDLLRQSKQ